MDPQQIANLVALFGVVVAYVALYRQSVTTEKQLKLTEAQLQNSISPVLNCTFDKERKEKRCLLTFTNGGSIPVSDIRVYGKMSGVFDCEKDEFIKHESQLLDIPIIDALGPGDFRTLELFSAFDGRLVTHLVQMNPIQLTDKSILAYTLVMSFRRQSDMKPYHRLIQFEGGRATGASLDSISFVLPLRMAPNMTSVSRSPISGELRCRKRMTEICTEIFDLENKDVFG